MDQDDKEQEPLLRDVGEILSLGFAMAISITGGFLLGYFVDSRVGSFPVLTLVGLGLGIAGGGYKSYKTIMKFIK